MGIVGTFVENGIIPYHWGCCTIAACESAPQCTEKVLGGLFSFLPAFKSKLLSNESFLGLYTLSVAVWYLMSDRNDSTSTGDAPKETPVSRNDSKSSSQEASAGKSIFEGKLREPPRRGILRKPNQEGIHSPKDTSPKSSARRNGQPQVPPPIRTPEQSKPIEIPPVNTPAQDSSRKTADEATSSAQSLRKPSTSSVEKPPARAPSNGFCTCTDRECEGSTSDWGRTTSAETSIEFPSGYACEPIDRCPHCGLYHTVNQNALNRRNVPTRKDDSMRLAMGDSDIEVVANDKVMKQVFREVDSVQGKEKVVLPQSVKLEGPNQNNIVKRPPVLKQTTKSKTDVTAPMKGKQRVSFNFDRKQSPPWH